MLMKTVILICLKFAAFDWEPYYKLVTKHVKKSEA